MLAHIVVIANSKLNTFKAISFLLCFLPKIPNSKRNKKSNTKDAPRIKRNNDVPELVSISIFYRLTTKIKAQINETESNAAKARAAPNS